MTQSPEPVDTFHLLRAHPDDTPNIRLLRWAVIAMGVVLAIGFAAVVARIVYLTTRTPAPAAAIAEAVARPETATPAAWAGDLRLALPAGAKVRSQSLSGNRLSVHYEAEGREGIIVLDLETGRPVGQIRIETGPK